jgi:hypothetical protein
MTEDHQFLCIENRAVRLDSVKGISRSKTIFGRYCIIIDTDGKDFLLDYHRIYFKNKEDRDNIFKQVMLQLKAVGAMTLSDEEKEIKPEGTEYE